MLGVIEADENKIHNIFYRYNVRGEWFELNDDILKFLNGDYKWILQSRTDYKRLREMKEEDIDYSDIPKMTKEEFESKEITIVKRGYPPTKKVCVNGMWIEVKE